MPGDDKEPEPAEDGPTKEASTEEIEVKPIIGGSTGVLKRNAPPLPDSET